MTLLLQVSDPHFGTERADAVAALRRLAHEVRPDVLVLSGDLTQRATRAQFAAARAFADSLGVPARLVIPGNHDIPLVNLGMRLVAPYARHRAAFGADLEPEHDAHDLLLLGVNTTRWWRHEDGQVSAAQAERVAARLARARPAQWRVVVVHQPVAVTRSADRKNLLHGHAEAVQRWARAGADVVMGGHIHLPFVLPLRDAWPSLPRPMWAVQAGTAVSDRVRADAGNSVNLLRIGRTCSVERWDHSPGAGRFEQASVQALSRDDAA